MSRKPRPAPRPIDTPWMTPAETCLYLRWVDAFGGPNLHQFYIARSSHGLPASKAAGALRCHRQYIDQWVLTGVTVFDDPQGRQRRLKADAPASKETLSTVDVADQPGQFVSR